MKQFYQFDAQFKGKQKLDSDGKLAYMYICDRMKSSRMNKQFYDKKHGDYFVLYTIEEMMKDLDVGKGKVVEIYNTLVEIGLLVKRRQYSRATKLFLPKFENETIRSSNNEPLEVQNSESNQSYLNQSNQSEIDTVNTASRAKNNYPKIEQWKNSVSGKLKLYNLVIDKILDYTHNDVKKAHYIVGIILKAKNKVAKQNHLSNQPVTRFESNANLRTPLAIKLQHVFSYLPNKVSEQGKYLMAALKTFFLEAFGLKKDEQVKPQPKSNKATNIVEPKWLNEPEDAEETEDEKLSILEMILIKNKLIRLNSSSENKSEAELTPKATELLNEYGLDPAMKLPRVIDDGLNNIINQLGAKLAEG